MNQDFQSQKQKQLSQKDNSSIGKIDKQIKKLADKINSKKEYYTTSSCAGRIVLIKDREIKEKGLFLFVSHERTSFEKLKKEIEKIARDGENKNEIIYFKQEPCILHVACDSLESGNILLKKAIFSGWKRSGMITFGKRFILEMISTEKLELPLIDKGKILIDDNFLKILAREANKRLERTREKIRKFEKVV